MTLTDITHSVIDPTTVSTQAFEYNNKDCYENCGEVDVFIYLPIDAPPSLASIVILDGNNVKVTSDADYNVFGTYEVEIYVEYASCTDTNDSGFFTLTIECDESNSEITLTDTRPATLSTDYFNAPVTTTTMYSHYRCEPPTFTFEDETGETLSWITGELVDDTIDISVLPTDDYSLVGTYNV